MLKFWRKMKEDWAWSTVVVKDGMLKVHDVEAKFYPVGHQRDANGKRGMWSAKLWQDRWNTGLERFRLSTRKVRRPADGMARLWRDGELVAEFAFEGDRVDFKFKGDTTSDVPLMNIGDDLRLEVGDTVYEAVVEPD